MPVFEAVTLEDEQSALVARAAGGDRTAFAQIYHNHHRQILQYFLYRVRGREDAEDLTQQTFLQAWRSLVSVGPKGSPLVPWLLTIAHNLVVSYYRRKRTTESIEDYQPMPDPEGDPAIASDLRFDHERVRAAVLTLKPEQQQVLLLRYLQGLSHRAIADSLGKSEVNVRVIQHRALAEVRRILTGEPDTW